MTKYFYYSCYNKYGDNMIYIDLLVIEDLCLNYIVLLSVGILLNRITKLKKVFLSSVIGIIPIVFLILDINKLTLFLITIIFAFIMAIISFNYIDIIYTIRNVIYMYLISIFLAGSIYLINIYFLPQINSSVLLVIVYLLLSPVITILFIKSMRLIKTNYSNCYMIDIYFKDKPKITVNSYLDTGNNLTDPYFHKPVILVSKKIIDSKNNHLIMVPYNTIDSHGILPCIKPEKIYIHGIGYRKNLLVGIIDEVNIEGSECILNKQLLERI